MFWLINKKLFFWYTLLTKGLIYVEVQKGFGIVSYLNVYSLVYSVDFIVGNKY